MSDQPQKKGEVGIGIDFKKIIVKVGGTEIQPMPDVNGLEGTFVMEKILETVVKKEKERRERVAHYYLQIEGVKLEAPASVYELMFAATSGRKVYNSTFKYEWSLYDFTISNTGIAAEALEMLDYGTEKFLRCQIGDTMVYVKTDREYRGKIHLLPDVSKVSVIESERQIRIV